MRMNDQHKPEITARLRRARNLFESGEFGQAITAYEEIVEENPDDRWACEIACASIGEIHLLFRERDMARDSYRRALVYNPRETEYYYQLGLVEMTGHDSWKAVEHIDFCIKREPGRFAYLWVGGLLHWRIGHVGESIGIMERALTLEHVGAREMESLGTDLLYLPDFRLALGYARLGVSMFPSSLMARRILKTFIRMHLRVSKISKAVSS